MCKKLLSLFLAFALLIGQTPAVFALDSEAAEDPVVIEQVISDEVSDAGEDASEIPSDDEQGDLTETPDDSEEDAAASETEEDGSAEETKETESVGDASDEGEDESAVTTVSGAVAPDPGLPSNDELFEAYAEQVLYGNSVATFGTAAGARLSGDEKLLYDALVPYIRQIAAGERASAVIAVGQNLNSGTAVDTEVVFAEPIFTGEALSNVLNALLSDYPYEMYWYDKTVGCSFTLSYYKVTLSFTVAQSYRGADEYTADTAKTGLAAEVAANAQSIVDKYANSADLDKLTAYKQEICSLVSYDDDAAASGNFSANSDSWQLINVFDNDTSTNVVCEGYSKAFMYLCDLSDFTGDVVCYTVSGYMDGGAHMWNIVTMDGCNYFADVTNSDSGMIGQNGGLFLVTADGSADDGYVFLNTYYMYDSETKAMWGTDADSILTLGTNTTDSGDVEEVLSGNWGDNVTWVFDEETSTLTLSGEGEIDSTLERDTPWYDNFDRDIINLVINEGITGIGAGTFKNCTNLKNIQFPNSMKTIGGAFYNCVSLTEIIIPFGVTTIGNSAFEDCSGLISVTIPASVTSIGEGAFFLCTALTTVNYGGTEDNWANVAIGERNDPLLNATIVYAEDKEETPHLFATWPEGEDKYTEYILSRQGSCSFEFWFGTYDNPVKVAYEDLSVRGIAFIAEGEYYENGEWVSCVDVSATSFGEGAVIYTDEDGNTYEFTVTCPLPEVGIYSSATRSEETYLDALRGDAGETLEFYVLGADGWSAVTDLTVTDENDNVISVDYDPNTGLVQMTAPTSSCYLYFIVVSSDWGADFWFNYINTGAQLFATWAGETEGFTSFSLPEQGSCSFEFHFGNEEESVAVAFEDLSVRGIAAISEGGSYDENNEWVPWVDVSATGFGEGAIIYTDADGNTYEFPVTCSLPYYGFYSCAIRSENSYLDHLNGQGGETLEFYLLAAENVPGVIDLTATDESGNEISVEYDPDSGLVQMTAPELGGWLIFNMIFDGRSETEWIEYINTAPHLFAAQSGLSSPEYFDNLQVEDKGGYGLNFYFGTVPSAEQVSFADLTATGVVTIFENEYYNGNGELVYEIVVRAPEFGEGAVIYTDEDGNTYEFPVIRVLPEHGFYSSNVRSEETYLDALEGRPGEVIEFYLLAVENESAVTELTAWDDYGNEIPVTFNANTSLVQITAPESGSEYLKFNMEFNSGSRYYWIEFIDTTPRLFVEYFDENEGDPFMSYTMAPSEYFGNIFDFYFGYPGNAVKLDVTDLSAEGVAVIEKVTITDESDNELVVPFVRASDFGEGAVIYTVDGVEYKFPVLGLLPDLGAYSSNSLSEVTYIDTYSGAVGETVTVYLLGTDEFFACETINEVMGVYYDENYEAKTLDVTATQVNNGYVITFVSPGGDIDLIAELDARDSYVSLLYIGEAESEDFCENGHTEVVDAAVAVTCTTAGLTEGKHCSECGEVIVAQKPIPATGHYYDAGTVIAAPTCTTDGKAVTKCTVCGDTINARNLDEILVKRLISTAYMIAEAPVYDYGPEYILSRMVWKYDVDYTYRVFTVSAEEFEAEVGRYFKMDTMMIQMLREYAASLNPEYASIYYNADSNTYTISIGGGMGGWNDERQYVGYVKNGGEYTAYYKTINYVYPSDVLPEGTDTYEYFEELGWPSSFEYGGYTFQNGPDGYYCIAGYEDSGRAVTTEFNDNVVRIVKVWDFTAAELPAEFDDVDGGMTGHIDNDGDSRCDVCGENICASHVPTAIPAVDANCTANGLTEGTKCENCGKILEQQEVVGALGHDLVEWVERTPSCDMAGAYACYSCQRCGKIFDINDPTKELTDNSYGEPTDHHFVVVEGKAPTCTEAGNLPYRYCDNSYTFGTETVECPERYITIDGVEENWSVYIDDTAMIERAYLPATGHDAVYVEAKEATYTAAGCNEHYKCVECGAYFHDALDAAGNKPCAKEEVIIPQLVEVTDGKAEVKEEVIEEAISNATETTVTLPLTETAEETVAAQLPVASLEKIAEAEKELTIETNFATVTMDTAALNTIVAEAGDADSIELVVEEMATEELNSKQQTAISEKKVAAVISAEILVNGDNVHDFDGGVVTVKIPFAIPEGGSPDDYYLVYVDEMGNIEEIPSKHENGYLVAELKHFSEYVVMDDSQPDELTVTRIAGQGRSETAVQAANVLKAELGVAKFDRIILANGLNFADALAGSYLAAVKSAPILLYSNAASVTLNEDYILENLSDDGIVYLLGGSAAVPQNVEDRLVELGITVKRLYGTNRFGTNLEILEEAGVQPGSEILVATGMNFADSLSASATGKPILLVNGKGSSLTDDQRAYLAENGGGQITILGGTGAVSASIEAELRDYGEVNRLAGSSRYATSTLIAEEYFGAVDTVVIAYGLNFPDGLSGGPVAYAMNAPLVLTAAKSEAAAAEYVAANPVTNGYIMGGTGALSEETVNKIFEK